MPIKPDIYKRVYGNAPRVTGRVDRDYSQHNRSPQSSKTDRETKVPNKSDRIYNKPEFKQSVKKTEDDFSRRSFGILKRLDGSSVPRR